MLGTRHRSFRQAALLFRQLSTATPQSYDQAAFGYCASQVKQYDYENFVWVVQLPKDLRAAVLALRAFNIEAALVGEHAKEGGLLSMRYQWWRDGLNGCFVGKPHKHPVLTALTQVLQRQQLTRLRLQKLVDGREEDAVAIGSPMRTLQELEAYTEGTAAQLLYLQLEAAQALDQEAHHTAMHLGKAVGIAKLLQGTRYFAQLRRTYLPADLLAKHGVPTEAVYRGPAAAGEGGGLQDVTLAVASCAKQHLDEARERASSIPSSARPLMLPSLWCGNYLEALQKVDFDLFHPSLAQVNGKGLGYQVQVKWNMMRGTY